MSANLPITIGQVDVHPGQRVNVNLPVADLYTATSLHMPVRVICGRKAGPVMFVSAAVHGDELNGVEIIRRLLKRAALKSLRGTLLAVPIVNVHGFLDQSRYLPDRRDLNRSFPGSPSGSIASRLANTFMREIMLKSNLGIDLHTGAVDRSNLPQVRAHLDDAETQAIARTFGAPVVVNAGLRDGSLRASAAEHGIPTIVYEAGEALRFDEFCIEAGVTREHSPVVASLTRWVRAPASGIVTGKATLGSRVQEGQRLAQVSDPLGNREEEVISPFDGIVIGLSNLPLAHEGDALFHIAAFRSAARAESVVEEFTAMHDPRLPRTVETKLRGT
jgi:predicted deacylase